MRSRGPLLLGFCFALNLACLTASGAEVTSSLTTDRTDIRLSESLRITLSIEGPGPLRVDLPSELLDESSAANWQLRPAGTAAVTDLPGGRQRWSQVYRVDPFLTGEAVPLGLAPINVFAGGNPRPTRITPRPFTIRVTSGVTADPGDVRPPTGIEELPALPSSDRAWEGAVIAVVAFVAVTAVGVLVWSRIRRRREAPLSPEEWAVREFDSLERSPPAGAVFAGQLSAVVRTFVARRTGIEATRQTTAEFVAAAERADPPPPVERVRSVLEWCDYVKFAGRIPSVEECLERLADARSAVAEISSEIRSAPGSR